MPCCRVCAKGFSVQQRLPRGWLGAIALALAGQAVAAAEVTPTPQPTIASPSLWRSGPEDTVRFWNEERVAFWISIYTQYNSTQTVLHDSIYPHITYEVMQFAPGSQPMKDREISVAAKKKKYQE